MKKVHNLDKLIIDVFYRAIPLLPRRLEHPERRFWAEDGVDEAIVRAIGPTKLEMVKGKAENG